MMMDRLERIRAIVAEAADCPGRSVTIPADLAREVLEQIAISSRPEIEEVRRRENRQCASLCSDVVLWARAWFEGDADAALAELEHRAKQLLALRFRQ